MTEPEAYTQREQGKVIGPTIDDRPVRKMDDATLRELLFQHTQGAQESRRKHWHQRQVDKIKRELRRRGQ